MKVFKNRRFYASILLDFSFLFILYLFLLFIIQKIRNYAYVLQEFGSSLTSMESAVQTNLSMMDYSLLLNNIDAINQVAKNILLLFSALLIGSFWLYIVFQGVQWSLILSKFKNFWKYFAKFSLISLLGFSLFILFSWYMLLNAKNVILNYFINAPVFGLLAKIILLYALLFLLGYYLSVCYVLLNKYKVFEALKKTLLFNHMKSMLVYLAGFISIIIIMILFLVLNLYGIYWAVIEVILILLIVNRFRYYLAELLKKY